MSSSKTKIFFRADGNSEIGLGHVIRSLALVEMLKFRFECIFLIRNPDIELIKLIESYCTYIPLDNNISYSDEAILLNKFITNKDVLVIDGYHFDSEYQQKVKSYIYKLVSIDDEAKFEIYADLLINHGNPNVGNKYALGAQTKLLLGTDYLLVRDKFRKVSKQNRNITKTDSLFICMGGADSLNITSKVFSAALASNFINRIIIVTGSAYQHKEILNNQINSISDKSIIWKQNIGAEEMIALIEECEMAFSTASSIALEIACVKIGMVIGMVAKNQQNIHDYLVSEACAISAGDLNKASIDVLLSILSRLNNKNLVECMIQNQSKLIDGNSGIRLLSAFKELAVC